MTNWKKFSKLPLSSATATLREKYFNPGGQKPGNVLLLYRKNGTFFTLRHDWNAKKTSDFFFINYGSEKESKQAMLDNILAKARKLSKAKFSEFEKKLKDALNVSK